MNILMIALLLRLQSMKARRDQGQGTLEYVGMIAVAALLIGAVVTAFADGSSLGDKVSNAIETVTSIG